MKSDNCDANTFDLAVGRARSVRHEEIQKRVTLQGCFDYAGRTFGPPCFAQHDKELFDERDYLGDRATRLNSVAQKRYLRKLTFLCVSSAPAPCESDRGKCSQTEREE